MSYRIRAIDILIVRLDSQRPRVLCATRFPRCPDEGNTPIHNQQSGLLLVVDLRVDLYLFQSAVWTHYWKTRWTNSPMRSRRQTRPWYKSLRFLRNGWYAVSFRPTTGGGNAAISSLCSRGTQEACRNVLVRRDRRGCASLGESLARNKVASPVLQALRMESLINAIVAGTTAAGMIFLLYIAFPPKTKKEEPKTKQLRQCPTCKRWQEVS